MSISQCLELKRRDEAHSFLFPFYSFFFTCSSEPAKLMSHKTSNNLFLHSFDNALERRSSIWKQLKKWGGRDLMQNTPGKSISSRWWVGGGQ